MKEGPGLEGVPFKITLDRDWLTPSNIPYQIAYNYCMLKLDHIKPSGIHPEFQNEYKRKMNTSNIQLQEALEALNTYPAQKGWEKMEKLLDEHYPKDNILLPYKQEKSPYRKYWEPIPQKDDEDLKKMQDNFLRELELIRKTEQERTTKHDEQINVKQGVKESDGKLDYELDWTFITLMAEVMSKNKGKYPPYNWKKSMDIEKLKQALLRHTIAVMNGEYNDDGIQLGHLASIALNAMFIRYQIIKNK
jgi:hypothetical protein